MYRKYVGIVIISILLVTSFAGLSIHRVFAPLPEDFPNKAVDPNSLSRATEIPASVTLPARVAGPNVNAVNITADQTAVAESTPLCFTIVALPDTQYYSQDYPAIFDNQTQWVVGNVESMNIAFVSQEGDIVNTYTDLSQWNNANHSLSMLDNHVPWGVLPGYNDGVYAGDLTNYNNYFGYNRFSGESWYGGAYLDKNTNSFQLFSVGEDQYLIFHFQYNPSNRVLQWADTIIDEHNESRVIVVTHNYLYPDGTRTSIGSNIWQRLVQPHADQIFLVLCAGEHAEASRTDSVNGHTVYQLLSNYQTRSNGGNGWLRIYQFNPMEDRIYVKTYSPYLNSFETDSDSQFILNYNMTGPSYILTVNVTPTGSGTVSRNNTGPYYYGDEVMLTAVPTIGWAFSSWSGDLNSSVNPTVITVNSSKTVIVSFTHEVYFLTATVLPEESGSVNLNDTGPYDYDDAVELTAVSTIGWLFSNWTGDLIGSVNPSVIIIDGNKTVTASFSELEYSLNVIVSPFEGGSVSRNSSEPYHYGDWVELTATANLGWSFTGWGGDASSIDSPVDIFIDRNKIVTANFIQLEYNLTVTVSPIEGGYVALNKTGSYHYGDCVRLTAVANSGWAFSYWSGNASGTISQVDIPIDGNKSVTANFARIRYALTVSMLGQGGTNATGTFMHDALTNVTVLATPAASWVFDQWTLNGTNVGSANPYTITMTGNFNLTAVFTQFQYDCLVVQGMDNAIYYRVYNSSTTSWGNWHSLPSGATLDSPAAALYSGKLYFVVRGLDGYSLWFSWVNLTDYSFSDWTWLSGTTESKPTLTCYDTQLVLVVRGLDNGIHYRFYDCIAGAWGDWISLPTGATPDTPAATVLDGELHFVVRGSDGYSLWHSWINLTDYTFSDWTWLSGATESKPTLTKDCSQLVLLVGGLDGDIWYRFYDTVSDTWEGWHGLPAGSTSDSPAATTIDGELMIVVRGAYDTSLWCCEVDLSTDIVSNWEIIGGATPSSATLSSSVV